MEVEPLASGEALIDTFARIDDAQNPKFGLSFVLQQIQTWQQCVEEYHDSGVDMTQNDEFRSVCNQLSTWLLCMHLRCAELRQLPQPHSSSHLGARARLLSAPSLIRMQAALEWLESCSELRPDDFRGRFEPAELLPQSAQFGTAFDPLNPPGSELLARTLWHLVRLGHRQRAEDLMRQSPLHIWRVASMSLSLFATPHRIDDSASVSDNDVTEQHFSAWLSACQAACANTALPPFERALYGICCGDLTAARLPSTLSQSSTVIPSTSSFQARQVLDGWNWSWEDDLWARLSSGLSQRLNGGNSTTDINSIMSTLDSNDCVYRTLQRHLLAGDYQTALQQLAELCTERHGPAHTSNYAFKRFATHMALYLGQRVGSQSNDSIHEHTATCVRALVMHAVQDQRIEFVFPYTTLLPVLLRRTVLSDALLQLHSHTQRVQLISAAVQHISSLDSNSLLASDVDDIGVDADPIHDVDDFRMLKGAIRSAVATTISAVVSASNDYIAVPAHHTSTSLSTLSHELFGQVTSTDSSVDACVPWLNLLILADEVANLKQPRTLLYQSLRLLRFAFIRSIDSALPILQDTELNTCLDAAQGDREMISELSDWRRVTAALLVWRRSKQTNNNQNHEFVSAALHALQPPLFAHTTSDVDIRAVLADRRNIITKQLVSALVQHSPNALFAAYLSRESKQLIADRVFTESEMNTLIALNSNAK